MTAARRFALILAVGLAIALAGCGALSITDSGDGGPDVNTSNYDATELAQSAQQSMQDVETYTFSMDMEVEASGQMSQSSIEMDGEGRANHATERMYMDMEMDVSSGSQSASEDVEAYQIRDTMYMNIRDRWQTQPAQEGAWTQTGPGMHSDLLENAEVSIEGAETINGEDTIVVSVEPDEETLEEVAASQSSADASAGSMEIESATVTQYISVEDPHYVMRTDMQMTAVADGVTTELDITMTMDDHNDDITIDVPEDTPVRG